MLMSDLRDYSFPDATNDSHIREDCGSELEKRGPVLYFKKCNKGALVKF